MTVFLYIVNRFNRIVIGYSIAIEHTIHGRCKHLFTMRYIFFSFLVLHCVLFSFLRLTAIISLSISVSTSDLGARSLHTLASLQAISYLSSLVRNLNVFE